MYLYFNKEGILETTIPHGEIVRQGSYLNIYVLLDEDFFSSRGDDEDQYSINVELAFPNEKLGTTSAIPVDEPGLKPFNKLDDSEITYALKENKYYWTYHFRFTPNQATMYAGKIFALVSIMQTKLKNPDDMESAVENDLLYYGKADLYVEKVFGFAKREVNEGELHYKNLVVQLNELNKRKVTKGYETINFLNLDINADVTGDIIKKIIFYMISNKLTGTYLYKQYLSNCIEVESGKYKVSIIRLDTEFKNYITNSAYSVDDLDGKDSSFIEYATKEVSQEINFQINESNEIEAINSNELKDIQARESISSLNAYLKSTSSRKITTSYDYYDGLYKTDVKLPYKTKYILEVIVDNFKFSTSVFFNCESLEDSSCYACSPILISLENYSIILTLWIESERIINGEINVLYPTFNKMSLKEGIQEFFDKVAPTINVYLEKQV